MPIFCKASNFTAPATSSCDPVGDDVFSISSLLLPSDREDVQQRCACASLLAIHMDIITERMSQVLPLHHASYLCSASLASTSCDAVEETSLHQLARGVFDFASAAIQVNLPSSLDGGSRTSSKSSCSTLALAPRVDCWCLNSSRSCPWELLVNADVLQGIMYDSPLPLSLAAALDQVRLFVIV
jgi:hypothetical protein